MNGVARPHVPAGCGTSAAGLLRDGGFWNLTKGQKKESTLKCNIPPTLLVIDVRSLQSWTSHQAKAVDASSSITAPPTRWDVVSCLRLHLFLS